MSRLPPPPRGKPLPPEPTGGSSKDLPPPLPSRPRAQLPAPPGSNGPSSTQEPDEYIEPDDWTEEKPRIPPVLPPRNFNQVEEGECYEEPDIKPLPPRLPPQRAPSPPGEIYDELEMTGGQQSQPPPPPPQEEPQETYDACSFEPEPVSAADQQEIYEETEDPPEDTQGSLYEFVPENEKPKPAAPAPPPVAGIPPQLPHRPPPAKKASDTSPELPSRTAPTQSNTKLAKKFAGEGQQATISLDELGMGKNRLRKISSTEEKKDPPPSEDPSNDLDTDANSVRDRILKFQGSKPTVPVKPSVSLVSAKSLGPPPPPPSTSIPSSPPANKPLVQKPPEKVSPPPPPQPAAYDEDEELYDEGFSYMDPLQGQEWFHGDLDRKVSNQKLNTIGEDGTFLVRKAQKGGANQPYTLVVLYQGHEYNLKVRKRTDGKVALGEPKDDEMAFEDVPALIEHHRVNTVILVNRKENQQHQTMLKKFPLALRR